MTGTQIIAKENGLMTAAPAPASVQNDPPRKRGPSIHQIYALPAPFRTFPLPAFYPNNPLSVINVACAWVRQLFFPPSAEPSVMHQGVWSEATNSVHITDEKSMRALWEQGFYGKGNLSRSEPNWLKREQVRRGQQNMHVSEVKTLQRREERAQAKWERARSEQEAIRQTKLKEAQVVQDAAKSDVETLLTLLPPPVVFAAPVGPLELVSLPNSAADAASRAGHRDYHDAKSVVNVTPRTNRIAHGVDDGPRGVTAATTDLSGQTPCSILGGNEESGTSRKSHSPNTKCTPMAESPVSETCSARGSAGGKSPRSEKSVRFSPIVDSTTFNRADPPSPDYWANGKAKHHQISDVANDVTASAAQLTSASSRREAVVHEQEEEEQAEIVNKEHLQLMPEEAIFLMFGFGALSVSDALSGRNLPTKELVTLFRQHSYAPPRNGPDDADLEPDDSFLVHYAVYHHFRSLGWVPRGGIKFGVDWLLYARGPVFDHAEFGLMVMPSYADPRWEAKGRKAPRKTWAWLHGVVRVLSHVMKSLVLVYVDIPPPSDFDAAMDRGFAEALKLYKIQEIMVKRWSSNRNR